MAQKTGIKLSIEILRNGGVGVMPTDTIYGLVGSALLPGTVKRIYKLRKRNLKKPMIILIGSLRDLELFKVRLTGNEKNLLDKLWPGKVSVVLPLPAGRQVVQKFSYLHRGTKSLAFRLPRLKWLRQMLLETGPLVAPSANWEGKKPATTVKEARKYFSWAADFYFDRGKLDSSPSTLVSLKNGRVRVLREGAVKIKL